MPAFSHFDLALLNPAFDSPLVDVLTELEHLRRLQLSGTTPAPLFFQLKRVFHMLESLGSARIEGNHTTLADYVETALDGSSNASAADPIHEVANIEAAMAYVDEVVQAGQPITEHLVRELHAQTVQGLRREGDPTPGAYRSGQVRIAQAQHLPPPALRVPDYMQELVAFINRGRCAQVRPDQGGAGAPPLWLDSPLWQWQWPGGASADLHPAHQIWFQRQSGRTGSEPHCRVL